MMKYHLWNDGNGGNSLEWRKWIHDDVQPEGEKLHTIIEGGAHRPSRSLSSMGRYPTLPFLGDERTNIKTFCLNEKPMLFALYCTWPIWIGGKTAHKSTIEQQTMIVGVLGWT